MSCMEALREHLKQCELCKVNDKIFEFEELPEHEKYNFDWYEKDKHFIIYCNELKTFKILPE